MLGSCHSNRGQWQQSEVSQNQTTKTTDRGHAVEWTDDFLGVRSKKNHDAYYEDSGSA